MSVGVYESTLVQAKNDLTITTRAYEVVRTRKELMEKLLDALTQLTTHLNTVEEFDKEPETPGNDAQVETALEASSAAVTEETNALEAPSTMEAAAQLAEASPAEIPVAHVAAATEVPPPHVA